MIFELCDTGITGKIRSQKMMISEEFLIGHCMYNFLYLRWKIIYTYHIHYVHICQRIDLGLVVKMDTGPKLLRLEITLKECLPISISRYILDILVTVDIFQSKGAI